MRGKLLVQLIFDRYPKKTNQTTKEPNETLKIPPLWIAVVKLVFWVGWFPPLPRSVPHEA